MPLGLEALSPSPPTAVVGMFLSQTNYTSGRDSMSDLDIYPWEIDNVTGSGSVDG